MYRRLAETGGTCSKSIILQSSDHIINILYVIKLGRSEYKLLLSYTLTFWYSSDVLSRPRAVGFMTVGDFRDLCRDGVVVMSDFKTQATFMVQPLATSESSLRYF
jgi:hypothetical protein